MAKAPRCLSRLWPSVARGAANRWRLWHAGQIATLCAVALAAPPTAFADIAAAHYGDPTTRYAHGVLGDAIEFGSLTLQPTEGAAVTVTLPNSRVFEDVAPRVVDATGDGQREAVVVESDQSRGARLAIYNADGFVAATPFIGTRFRWLAPVAVADLDGDGSIELAYVDRPHLAKTLRVWRFVNGRLNEVTALVGVTNHRIGEPDIAGGLRDCGDGPEMVVATADWRRLLAVTFDGKSLDARDIGAHEGRPSFAAALAC